MRKMLATATAKLILLLLLPFYGITQNLIPNTTPVVENFNGMGSSATATIPPFWTTSAAGSGNVSNWSTGNNSGITSAAASSGSPTAGGRYNWATTAGTDRALGFMTSSDYVSPNSIMTFYRNTTGGYINSLTISFNVERYRINTATCSVAFFTSLDGSTWIPQAAGNISTSDFATGASSYTFATPTTVTKNVSINNIAVPNNGDIYLRWVFTNTGSINSQGLGLDDVSLTAGIAPPSLTANLGDNLVDGNANNLADVGETIQYRDTIKNAGAGSAEAVNLTNTAPAGTTFTPGTVKTSALARDDNYTTTINTAITSTNNRNVLTNDYGLPSITVFTYGTVASGGITTPAGVVGATTAGGSITISAAGLITNYTPPSNFTGVDQFKYIARAGAGLPDNDAIVNITVTDIIFTTTNNDPACNGSSNGNITFSAAGGIGALQYSITGAAGTYQASNIFTGLAAGIYNLAVKDASGFIRTGTATLTNPASIVVSGTTPVNLTYNVAMSTVTYTKTGGAGTPANPWSIVGLPPGVSINTATGAVTGTPTSTGTYNGLVIYTDANGCTGSLSVVMPVAPNLSADAYNVVGNTQLVADGHSSPTTPFTSSATNILANDASNQSITVTSGTFATANGGSITIAVNGKFTYTPPAGSTAADSYTYTATSGGVSATATITFNISFMVWYVNNTYTGGNGAANGTSHRPYTTVNAAVTPSASSHVIYVHTGSGNTTGDALLKTSQTLIGAGAILNVGTLSIPAGTKPTLSGMITLASGANVSGFDMSTGTTTAITNAGTTVTAVTVNVGNVTTSTGTGITLTGTGNSVTMTLASLTTVQAPTNVSLTNTAGTVTINGGSILSAGNAVLIDGGTASVTCNASITQNAVTRVIDVQNKTAGTVAFGGTINAAAGSGIFLNNNSGATINFTNTIDLNSTTNPGFTATAGGTISATGAGSDLFSTTGTTLNLANVTVGAGGLTFASVNANTAVNAINLNTVTGTITINGGSITGGAGAPINIVGGTVSLTYSGGASQANASQPLVSVSGGHTTGTITFNTGTLSATGGTGLQFDNADGTYNFSGTTNLNGGNAGIDILTGSSGSFTFSSSTSVTNPSGGAFVLSNSTASVTYNGTMSKTSTGIILDVQNETSGTVSFTGAISQTTTSGGINLGSNGGTTISFSGGITLSTGTNIAFSATGGGTINVTGTNTLTTTTATALNVANTTIGASNLNFQSISSNGGSGDGIILSSTGAGGLTVTGTGSAGSGGTIANKTGADLSTTQGSGIYLSSASNINLSYMQLNTFQNWGIYGTNVTNFNFNNSVINGVNGTSSAGGSREGAIAFLELYGNCAISNSTIGGPILNTDLSFSDHLRVWNTTGAQSLNRLTVSNCTFGRIGINGNDAMSVVAFNSSVMNVTVQDCIFTNTIGVDLRINANNNTTVDAIVRRNKFSNNNVNASGGAGLLAFVGGGTGSNSTMTYDISCNTFRDAIGIAALVAMSGGTGTSTGSFVNNAVGVSGVALSGSTQASGFKLALSGCLGTTHNILIQNNNVLQTNEEGIFIQNNNGTATVNATVFGNTVAEPGGFSFAGLNVDIGAGVAGDASKANVVIGSATNAALKNDFSAGDPSNFSDVNLSLNTPAGGFLNLSKNGSVAATAVQVIKDNNNNPATTNTGVSGVVTLVTTLPATPPAVTACTRIN